VRTHLALTYAHEEELPAGYSTEVRTPDALVETFVRAESEPGDRVLDPFAGFGTTLLVAERLGRRPHGIEYEPDRVAHVRDRLEDGVVRAGDARSIDADRVPPCELCFTSPPFVTEGMSTDAFENYSGESSYEAYLADVETVARGVRRVLAPDGTLVVDVANLKHEGRVTTLAWDVADAIRRTGLQFRGEVVVTWEGDGIPDSEGAYGYGYDHTYCLVYDAPDDPDRG
jgi:SAM-dependent methyltransferase